MTPGSLRAARSFFSEDMIPLMMLEPGEDIDIDTERDWLMAQLHVDSKEVVVVSSMSCQTAQLHGMDA